ncbi:MAG TPA: gluconokinase [Lacunisphaera sp.]
MTSPKIILIMGVAGSGKSTIGRRLAAELGWPYHEADDFHSAANKEKMSRGIPLDDYDRAPWLASIRAAMDDCLGSGQSAVFTCSGLKEKYRRVLMDGAPGVSLVYLACDFETSLARVGRRQNHYMKADMVKSQFEALEVPTDALTVDTKLPPDRILAEIRRSLSI